jgi:hypothetical protein
VLAVEAVEGGGRRLALAAGEAARADLGEGERRLGWARARSLLQARERLVRAAGAVVELGRLRQREARDRASRLARGGERFGRGVLEARERLERARGGEPRVIAELHLLDVRVRQVSERLPGTAGVEQGETGREARQPPAGSAGEALRHGVEGGRGVVAGDGLAHGGLRGVARLGRDPPRRRGARGRLRQEQQDYGGRAQEGRS